MQDSADDQPPPVTPRKHSVAEMTTDKALPNTYVKIEKPMKKGLRHDASADVDSDHDYETVDDTLVTMIKKAQEDIMFY